MSNLQVKTAMLPWNLVIPCWILDIAVGRFAPLSGSLFRVLPQMHEKRQLFELHGQVDRYETDVRR